MTETTIFGIDRSSVRTAGWPAAVLVGIIVLFVEPWLQNQGLGAVAIALYVLLLPVIAWSLFEDIRHWRERRRTDSD
ncbi:hypothetical protein [Haloarcula argentinensis]|uniref:Uncharacterized protein n=1 Tax=Haloarcula argentinensis TaxID=43776 RepID=A0A830FX24_HALAR|nr:hypothetical protein [Haloarcula argentinensis]GGM52583.1 hypothetical protein GCM10009006_37190 [Haloarcula argentinensis]